MFKHKIITFQSSRLYTLLVGGSLTEGSDLWNKIIPTDK